MGPMTFDELSELYRMEMKSSSITEARKDLFRALANLINTLRQEYERQAAIDVESIMCEGAEARRKNAERLVKDIIRLRTQKICSMALRSATGSKNTLDNLTDEEKDYYESVVELTKRHISEVDRLRGRRKTVDTRIDEPMPVPKPAPEPPVEEEIPEPPPFINEQFDDEPFDDQPIPDDFDAFVEEQFADPTPAETPVVEEAPAPMHEEEKPIVQKTEDPDLIPVLIRVLEDLPEFAGPERDYSLVKEDIVTLPKVLADALVNTGKANVVRPTP